MARALATPKLDICMPMSTLTSTVSSLHVSLLTHPCLCRRWWQTHLHHGAGAGHQHIHTHTHTNTKTRTHTADNNSESMPSSLDSSHYHVPASAGDGGNPTYTIAQALDAAQKLDIGMSISTLIATPRHRPTSILTSLVTPKLTVTPREHGVIP